MRVPMSSRSWSANGGIHGATAIGQAPKETRRPLLPCNFWFWHFLRWLPTRTVWIVDTNHQHTTGTSTAQHRPHLFDRAPSIAPFHRAPSSSATMKSCSYSYSASRYSYSIEAGADTLCRQTSTPSHTPFVTVARIRVRVRVPACGLSTSTIGIKESNARTCYSPTW